MTKALLVALDSSQDQKTLFDKVSSRNTLQSVELSNSDAHAGIKQ